MFPTSLPPPSPRKQFRPINLYGSEGGRSHLLGLLPAGPGHRDIPTPGSALVSPGSHRERELQKAEAAESKGDCVWRSPEVGRLLRRLEVPAVKGPRRQPGERKTRAKPKLPVGPAAVTPVRQGRGRVWSILLFGQRSSLLSPFPRDPPPGGPRSRLDSPRSQSGPAPR